jgi:Nif-specific regulatory protein
MRKRLRGQGKVPALQPAQYLRRVLLATHLATQERRGTALINWPVVEAEIIAVSGPLMGERFALGREEICIGRGPSCDIRLTEHDAAWHHCVILPQGERYRILDRHTGAGTYVNGMRVNEHWLEAGDQISICETVLVYREGKRSVAADGAPQQTLVRSCSLIFLFRALALAQNPQHRATIEEQIVRLIADLTPAAGGAVLLGKGIDELRVAAAESRAAIKVCELIDIIRREGVAQETDSLTLALGLYARGELSGVLAARFPEAEAVNLNEHRDTLSAIASLASAALESVRDVEQLKTENTLLRERLDRDGIVGDSPATRKLLEIVDRLAPRDTSVLVLGESGVGKELVARALHAGSSRAARPFVAINCAALTETLLESELFGHEKGAFTGAVAQKKGKLEIAEGGTVFLDEAGEMTPPLQAKLLRVLQQREFERVGGTRTLKLDVRLIAATNRDLGAEVKRGAFREDLYHRLNVVAIRVPPLRERLADIPVLAQHFLARAAARCGRRVTGFSVEAEQHLLTYSWPGNIRELENAVERAVVLGQSEIVLTEDLPETVLDAAPPASSDGALQSSVSDAKRQLIIGAFHESGGDHNRAAALLKIHPNSLRRLIRTLGLREVL